MSTKTVAIFIDAGGKPDGVGRRELDDEPDFARDLSVVSRHIAGFPKMNRRRIIPYNPSVRS